MLFAPGRKGGARGDGEPAFCRVLVHAADHLRDQQDSRENRAKLRGDSYDRRDLRTSDLKIRTPEFEFFKLRLQRERVLLHLVDSRMDVKLLSRLAGR